MKSERIRSRGWMALVAAALLAAPAAAQDIFAGNDQDGTASTGVVRCQFNCSPTIDQLITDRNRAECVNRGPYSCPDPGPDRGDRQREEDVSRIQDGEALLESGNLSEDQRAAIEAEIAEATDRIRRSNEAGNALRDRFDEGQQDAARVAELQARDAQCRAGYGNCLSSEEEAELETLGNSVVDLPNLFEGLDKSTARDFRDVEIARVEVLYAELLEVNETIDRTSAVIANAVPEDPDQNAAIGSARNQRAEARARRAELLEELEISRLYWTQLNTIIDPFNPFDYFDFELMPPPAPENE